MRRSAPAGGRRTAARKNARNAATAAAVISGARAAAAKAAGSNARAAALPPRPVITGAAAAGASAHAHITAAAVITRTGTAAALLLAALFPAAMYAQTNADAFPDAPTMPTVSAPVFGGDFYTPGVPWRGGNSGAANAASSGNSARNPAQEKSSGTAAGASDSGTADTRAATRGTAGAAEKNAAALQNAGGAGRSAASDGSRSSRLSAADILTLGGDGLFSGVYSLLGDADGGLSSRAGTDAMLTRILEQLEKLNESAKNTAAAPAGAASENPAAAVSAPSSNSAATEAVLRQAGAGQACVLRFKINGCDMLGWCRTLYISDREEDGTFLFTGDCKYSDGGKTRGETFYMLFKSEGNSGARASYKVQPELVQDTRNENSFLYRLSRKDSLTAFKTGNLISLRVSEDGLSADILLDIGTDGK